MEFPETRNDETSPIPDKNAELAPLPDHVAKMVDAMMPSIATPVAVPGT